MASNTSAATYKPQYKYKFVSEPDDALKCLICLEVAEEPWQHGECGTLFCKKCLDDYGRDKPCHNCKVEQPQYLKDGKSKREIKALRVKCDNIERKCEWVGTVGTLEEHVATCEFTLLPCPKECEDNDNKIQHFMRKDLDEHLEKDCPNRDHTCEYCGEKGTYASVTQIHDTLCPKKILPCPNDGCSDTMQRQHVEKHVATECEFTVIPCKYRRLGCDAELKRKDMAAHEENDKLHLHMAIDTTVRIEPDLKEKSDRIRKLEEKTTKLQRELEDVLERSAQLKYDLTEKKIVILKNQDPISFKLVGYQAKKDANELVDSPSYYISPNGYHMAIRVYANGLDDGEGTHVSAYARILKGRFDTELKWPLVGTISLTLLNQLEDKNHHQMVAENAQVQHIWGCSTFLPHAELGHNADKNTQYLKDDTLYFRASVKLVDYKPWLE